MPEPTLSLCTFVKNEVDCVVGMIESVRSIVDEVVVVDTGSTDGTQDAVRPVCDHLIEVPFTDFGTVRTFTLKQANCDWILMLDADERILEADLPRVRALLTMGGADAFLFPRHQWDNLEMNPNQEGMRIIEEQVYPDFQARLFVNKPSMKYVGKVHERLLGFAQALRLDGPDSPHIQHFHAHFKDHKRRTETYAMYEQLQKGSTGHMAPIMHNP